MKRLFLREDAIEMVSDNFEPDFVSWLKDVHFFDQPASTKYHGVYDGALFDHSMEVASTLQEMTDKMGLVWGREDSPLIIGLFHDLCKVDRYKKTNNLTSLEVELNPSQNNEYEYSDDCLLKGHGEKSIMLLSQWMTLTEEEIMCIRYHMGAYYTDEWKEYDKAIRLYQNVLWTHTADMYVSKVLNV